MQELQLSSRYHSSLGLYASVRFVIFFVFDLLACDTIKSDRRKAEGNIATIIIIYQYRLFVE